MKNCSTGRCERPASQRVVESCSAGADIPPSMAGGPGPAPGGIRPLRPHEGIRCTPSGPGTHDGVSIWHRRRSLTLEGPVDATASNLDTLLDRGIGRRVRMLLSFQRPSHLWGRGFLPTAHPEPFRFRSGPLSIAPVPPSWEVSGRGLLIVPAVSPERVLGVSAFRRLAFSHRCEPDWPRAGTRLREHLESHRPLAGTVVEVDQHHLLPGPERQTAVEHRDRLRGTDDRGP